MLSKIVIKNYRCYEDYTLDFNKGLNILVGDNDSGKSTLVEAIGLALTGRVGGRSIITDLSPFHFNGKSTGAYFAALQAHQKVEPPEIIIDLFMEKNEDTAKLQGTNNALGEDSPGIRIRIYPDPDLADEFHEFIQDPTDLKLIPVEYYRVDWLGFSGNPINARGVPATVSMIDASTIRLQSGADYYLQQIIGSTLTKPERAELSRQYRSIREAFAAQGSVNTINEKLTESHGDVSDRCLSLSIDISHRSTWESSLAPHLDQLPLPYVGKGEQSRLKVLLALSRQVDDTHVMLVEEPENHLSFASLNILLEKILAKCEGKQVFITTHSSYVLNKLGLASLILMGGDSTSLRITELSADSEDYFKKLPGYDTLRLVLARKVVLVEGPSDELILQRAYKDRYQKLPIHDGVDILSTRGLSFKRFLDLAVPLQRRVVVVRDNDGKAHADVLAGYDQYTEHDFITVRVGADTTLKTLEPQLLAASSLEALNTVLGRADTTDADLLKWMEANKTSAALAIFESESTLTMPTYITQALDDLA
ncbi:MAG: AAA family ATPase [Gammaproteobacteria bacterium]|nr:AAA family ATPase [Gammaproteobacteria bacterium]